MTLGSGHDFLVETLERHHDRTTFSCGNDALDRYLKTQATQDLRRKANAVFVMTTPDMPTKILGYFTLCAYTLDQGAIPEEARKYIPRYPLVSATLIGRLAVDQTCQGQGLGAILLGRALDKAYGNAAIVGSSMVVVDAIDERAVRFYQAHGFVRLTDTMRLMLPMATVGDLTRSG